MERIEASRDKYLPAVSEPAPSLPCPGAHDDAPDSTALKLLAAAKGFSGEIYFVSLSELGAVAERGIVFVWTGNQAGATPWRTRRSTTT
jgi:hypothetical protein